ncbi:WXG100 family type VII secretion target [Streptomyces megasporus]|uniref:WXG100 family type VII secretion target n=1 Tax=Streptomyces megasporus TaxID=44060 RepID=UPI00068AB070|nr:hypothetical protein [Streptomyces megasporus]
MSGGEFEDKSLAALHSMVANANPKALTSRGDALGKAGTDMDGIGHELRAYVERVQWKGQGGDAFREWGQQFALETMRFAVYARSLGRHLADAGQALTEAKAAIPAPEGMCYADPEKDKARQKEEEAKRQEAINQMIRLSSYYRMAGENIRGAEEPQFKAPPSKDEFLPGGNTPNTAPSIGSKESATYREPSVTSVQPVSAKDGGEVRPPLAVDRSAPVVDRSTPVVERPVHMTIDSVATVPVNETRPQTAPAPSQSSSGPSAPPVAPVASTSPVQRSGQASPRAPFANRPPAVSGGGVPPRGAGNSGLVPPRGPGNNGVIGGTPRQVGTPASGLPRGAVAGGDHATMGRPMGGHPGAAGGGSSVNRGMPLGRPMASQPGGTVGTPRSTGNHGRAFTPGGTGLVRGGAVTPGMAARPTNTSPPREDRRRGNDRPDYLAEDEETWASGQRNVVPPVID